VADLGKRVQIVTGDAGVRIARTLVGVPLEGHELEYDMLTTTYPLGTGWFEQIAADPASNVP
jgi:hypothetical protein